MCFPFGNVGFADDFMESHAAILSQNMENEQGIKRHGFAGSTLFIGKEPDDLLVWHTARNEQLDTR